MLKIMNKIESALQRTRDTKALFIGKGVVARTAEMFNKLFPGKTAVIIADTNTWEVAGKAVEASLQEAGVPMAEKLVIDDPELYAEWRFIEMIEDFLKDRDVIAIAVGSGVINDLTKLVSGRLGR